MSAESALTESDGQLASSRKRVAISQSNYIPWKGYFDMINTADLFVFLDNVQYTRRDWRNRNKLKNRDGSTFWLTIPVNVKGKFHQRIDETIVSDAEWAEKHWRIVEQRYAHTTCFAEFRQRVEELYGGLDSRYLSCINRTLVEGICELLGIDTKLQNASNFVTRDQPTQRLVDICRQVSATEYLSGPAAKVYLDESLFTDHGIEVSYMDYSGYSDYPQGGSGFVHEVSVLDLIFNTGIEATRYMKSFDR